MRSGAACCGAMLRRPNARVIAALAAITALSTACAVNPPERSVSVDKAVALTTTTVPAPTTTTVPAQPIEPKDLWSFIGAANLLQPWHGTDGLRPGLTVGLPTGVLNSVDLAALAGQTGMYQQATFEALADKLVVRRVVMSVHTDPGKAAAWVSARAPLFPPEQNATPASATVKGAIGFLYRPAADGPLYVRVHAARGPVAISVDVRQLKTDPVLEGDALAAADATLTAVMAAVDARLTTCSQPCTGANGTSPTSAVRPLQAAECAVLLPPGPDFLPPAQDSGGVACTEPHALHGVVTVPTGDSAAIYDTITATTPEDHPYRALVKACRAAVVQWITGAAYQPTAAGTFGLRVQLPARAAFDGGDRQALCILTPSDPTSGELLNGFALPG